MSTLTLTGLASHTMVDVNFLLGFLESWDSTNGPSCCSPDFVDIYIDGVKVESLTSNNASGSNEYYAGGTELYDDVEINTNYFYDDTLVDMSTAGFLNFAHSASTLTLGIQASGSGWQGSHDEGWGIDNVVINYDGQHVSVPEPATIALLGLGLVGFAASRRNKS